MIITHIISLVVYQIRMQLIFYRHELFLIYTTPFQRLIYKFSFLQMTKHAEKFQKERKHTHTQADTHTLDACIVCGLRVSVHARAPGEHLGGGIKPVSGCVSICSREGSDSPIISSAGHSRRQAGAV